MTKLDNRHVSKAARIVRQRFPEMAGVEPKVSAKQAHAKSKKSGPLYLLTFQKTIALPDGGRMTRVVRVTVDQEGEVLKVTSSR